MPDRHHCQRFLPCAELHHAANVLFLERPHYDCAQILCRALEVDILCNVPGFDLHQTFGYGAVGLFKPGGNPRNDQHQRCLGDALLAGAGFAQAAAWIARGGAGQCVLFGFVSINARREAVDFAGYGVDLQRAQSAGRWCGPHSIGPGDALCREKDLGDLVQAQRARGVGPDRPAAGHRGLDRDRAVQAGRGQLDRVADCRGLLDFRFAVSNHAFSLFPGSLFSYSPPHQGMLFECDIRVLNSDIVPSISAKVVLFSKERLRFGHLNPPDGSRRVSAADNLPLMRDSFLQARAALDAFLADEASIARVEEAAGVMAARLKGGGKILACGNGGSACDAMHFCEELTGRFRADRPALPAIACVDPGHITCTANDYGFEHVFSRWVEALGQKGDVLVVLSTSGNSVNVIKAVAAAKDRGLVTVGLLGKDGGELAGRCDLEWVIPGETADRIQEVHMLILHVLIEGIESAMF